MKISEFREMMIPYMGKGYRVCYDWDNEEGCDTISHICQYRGAIQLAGYANRVGEIGYERKVEIKDKSLSNLNHLIKVLDAFGWNDFNLCVENEELTGIAILENRFQKDIILTTEKYPAREMDLRPYYSTAEAIGQTVTWLVGGYAENRCCHR